MAGLPWFELDVDMPDDPKCMNLGARLRNPLAFAYVVRLYAYCYRHASDQLTAHTIEKACGWRGKPGALVSALEDEGFLDSMTPQGNYTVHGVAKRLGPHLAAREKAAERQRRHREKATAKVLGNALVTRDVTSESRGDTDIDKDQKQLLSGATSAPVLQQPPRLTPANAATETPAPKPSRSAAADSDPRKSEKRASFERIFREIRGADYRWQGIKDACAVRDLVAVPLDEWERRARVGLRASAYQQRISTVAQLGMRWNDLAGTGPPLRAVGAARVIAPVSDFKSDEF